MSKKSRRKEVPSAPRRPWLWLAMGAAVLLIAGGLVVWSSSNTRPAVTPQATGAPRLAVDRTTVDAGYVKFDKLVHTTFRLRNVGDQPLQILGEPQVELVEGC